MGLKQKVITELFQDCIKRNDYSFHNKTVKEVCVRLGFGNAFDVTKIDNTSLLPDILKQNDYCIIHLGKGNHAFIKGISYAYHTFEDIALTDQHDWKYQQSLLNEYDTSESNILSVASNQRILHDFLYEDIVRNPKVYNARRTKMDLEFCININIIKATKLQMEVDLTLEDGGAITVIEGKNGFPHDFAVYQIFNPFRYYCMLRDENKLDVKQINCCYILRKRIVESSTLRLYQYTFSDENNMATIKLLKSAQYKLIKR